MLANLIETQICCSPVPANCLAGGGSKKENGIGLGKSCPSSTGLKAKQLSSSCMSLALLELLSQCQSPKRMSPSVSKSMLGPSKRNVWDYSSPLPCLCAVPTDFHSQMPWGLLFQILMFWDGDPSVRLRPLAPLRGPLKPTYFSQFLTTTRGYGSSSIHISAPPTTLHIFFF